MSKGSRTSLRIPGPWAGRWPSASPGSWRAYRVRHRERLQSCGGHPVGYLFGESQLLNSWKNEGRRRYQSRTMRLMKERTSGNTFCDRPPEPGQMWTGPVRRRSQEGRVQKMAGRRRRSSVPKARWWSHMRARRRRRMWFACG